MISAVTVATTLVCFFTFAREAAGASCAPGIPHALYFEGERTMHNSGASRREGVDLYRPAHSLVVLAKAGTHNHRL